MKMTTCTFVFVSTLLCMAVESRAEVTIYINEAAYLSDLSALNLVAIHEGFEEDTAWGSVRTTVVDGQITAPSITNLGITWTANNDTSEVTTGSGPALTGDWGFFVLPHGDFATGTNCDVPGVCGDGFEGTSAQPIFGVGGWIETNTPPAELGLFIDGVQVDFGGDGAGGDANVLGTAHKFFGAIDTEGFTQFEFREMEGTIGDQKFIFADDFTLAVVPEPNSLLLLTTGLAILGVIRG